MKDGMKDVLYWSAYILIVLSIIIWSLVSLVSCSSPVVQEAELISVEHINVDSLYNMADSAVNHVHHTIDDLDNEIKKKEKEIQVQLIELKKIEDLSELKQQEALVEIERATHEKAQVDSLMIVLEEEFEKKWDAYDRELSLLERDIGIVIKELNSAVEEIVTVVIQLGQEYMLYDKSTKICELAGHLPPGRLDSLIKNTPNLKVKTKKNKKWKD